MLVSFCIIPDYLELQAFTMPLHYSYETTMDLLPIWQDSNIPKTLFSTTEYPSPSSEQLVNITIESYISHLTRRPHVGGDESFFVADLGCVVRQYQRWTQNLPRVRPYFGNTPLSKHPFGTNQT